MLALIKDWEQADARLQLLIEDEELEESFENLYLDVEFVQLCSVDCGIQDLNLW